MREKNCGVLLYIGRLGLFEEVTWVEIWRVRLNQTFGELGKEHYRHWYKLVEEWQVVIVKTDKHLSLWWLCNYCSLNTIVSWLVNRKIIEFYYHQNYHLIEKPVITFLKFRCISELSWKFLKNTNTQVFLYFFFCQSSRYISNEQPCLKNWLYEDLLLLSSLFHFFYFIFSAPISFSLCFPISPSLLCFMMFFLRP